jgi:biotin transport system substrate-specific component
VKKELSLQLGPVATTAGTEYTRLRPAAIVIAGSALAALCAHIVLPLFFTPVPLTLQPLAVLLLGLLLTPRLAAATLAAYLAEGALGLPVFAPGPLGIFHLLGPTGGYLLAYPAAAAMIAFLWRWAGRGWIGRGFGSALACAAAGNAVILASGALWFAALTHAPVQVALTQSVLPFLPGDALKIAAAAALATGFVRLRRLSA